MRGKEEAKLASSMHKKDASLGHQLDFVVEQLQCNQTNGIPQGGQVFNFIAEIVLGYSDLLLSEHLKAFPDGEWSVIRYRDDYRIFANSKETAEHVIKTISDILSELNMHFNTKKTKLVSDIIESAIKPDKIYWNARMPIIMPKVWDGKYRRVNYQLTLQKHLLEILWLSRKFPNSGSISKALTGFAKRLDECKAIRESVLPLVSIVADLISNNPKAIAPGVGVLSKLLMKGSDDTISTVEVVGKITKKLENTPNLEYLDIWLQRLSLVSNSNQEFQNGLCQSVVDSEYSIWDSSFIKGSLKLPSIVNREKIKELKSEIDTDVFDVFSDYMG